MNRSLGTIILIIVAVLIGIVLIGYAATSIHLGGSKTSTNPATSSITVGTSTTFLVAPRFVLPSARPAAGTRSGNSDLTPAAPAPSKGGFFSRYSGSKTLPAGFTQADVSPYYQTVTISSVRTSRSTSPTAYPDSVSLRQNAGDASVAISGWQLKTNRSDANIPRGVRLYHTTPTPLENIELRRGESATIYTNSSPLSANFMLNSCTGYLANSYPFNPPLPVSCQRPSKSEIETFTGTCQEYILRLNSCAPGDPNAAATAGDSSCRSYVASTLNYEGCVKRSQSSANFFTKEWRIWEGKSFLDPLHDRVLLLDQNGKLVDSYTY